MTEVSDKGQAGKTYESFFNALKAYLADPSPENLEATHEMVIKDLSDDSHDIAQKFWRSYQDRDIDEQLKKLRDGDRETWSKLLYHVMGNMSYSYNFSRFKGISPFAGRQVVLVHYGLGFIELFGDAPNLFDSLVRDKIKNFIGVDINERQFVVVLDKPDADKTEAHQAYCPPTGKKIFFGETVHHHERSHFLCSAVSTTKKPPISDWRF